MNSQDIFRPMRRFKQQLPDEEDKIALSTSPENKSRSASHCVKGSALYIQLNII